MDNIASEASEVLKYLGVYALSMVKFIGGPLLGIGSGLSFIETMLLTFLGMMSSVVLFSSLLGNRFSQWIKNQFYSNRKLFNNKTRRIVKVWRSYGLQGVAFLTPILFSPIIGTLIATSFGESKQRIYIFMTFSAIFWAVVLTGIIFFLKSGVQSV